MAKKPDRPHKKGPRKANKIGRNKKKCERYRSQSRREKNKEARSKRIQRGFRNGDVEG